MGQKRQIQLETDWYHQRMDSNWYGGNDYGDKLAEDYKIRKYIHARLSKASVSKVIIERTLKLVTVTITNA
jgi:small subunit ribosomal protein S3